MKKIFLDSDIILDALLKRPGFYLPAANVMALAYQHKIKLCTSAVSFVNVNYFLNKFDRSSLFSLLKSLRTIVSIIEVNEKMIDLALDSLFTDTEDAIQHFAAISAKADYILSRNLKDYKHSMIPVLTAEDYLNTL